jgi:hypothetical protein
MPVGRANHDLGRHADEEAILDDAEHRRETGLQRRWIGHLGDGAVGDVIAAIRRERAFAYHG